MQRKFRISYNIIFWQSTTIVPSNKLHQLHKIMRYRENWIFCEGFHVNLIWQVSNDLYK